MKLEISMHYIAKFVPLIISNKIISGQNNVILQIHHNGTTGFGETIFDVEAENQIQIVMDFLKEQIDISPVAIWKQGKSAGLNGRQLALIDLALWDLLAKTAKIPLFRLLGLTNTALDTSLTISLGEKNWVYERTNELISKQNPNLIKIKLGSPLGILHDQECFLSVHKAIKEHRTKLIHTFVDANGGWNLNDAKKMLHWLKKYNVQYVEQPLSPALDAQLKELFDQRPLPIYVDESFHFASDLKKLHSVVDGINIKLLKCGGITEALKIIHTARTFNLKIMLGCFGETPISLTGAASLSSLVDYVDLDSFLNLNLGSFPFKNFDLTYQAGKLQYGNKNGIGISYE